MSAKDWLEKDYYKILGVPKDAKPEQIKKAFHKIARENHPDQHPGDAQAEQRFKAASEAHAVLSDPKKRRKYDEQRRLFGAGGPSGFRFNRTTTANPEDVFRTASDAGLGDIFGTFFGSSGPRRTSKAGRRGADIEGQVTISFDESIEGATVAVQMTSDDACPACRGTGAKAGTSPRVCPTCQGAGVAMSSASIFGSAGACTECRGRGLIVDDPCAVCHGSGRSAKQRSMQVRVPAGVVDGQKIRIKGKGGSGENGGPAGDLYVVVHVRPHPIFGREGKNLTVTVPVTFAEAALGAEIEVPTLHGGHVTLRIPAGTPNGRSFRVRGRGVAAKGGTKGDLIATVDVSVPSTMNPAARDALRAYVSAAAEPNPRRQILDES